MKAGTTELLKFKRLQRRLGESVRGTVGLLEMLWLGTAKNAPAGDIGKFSNEEIAVLCDYAGDADELIAALQECGWLDPCDKHRLVVHDWGEHCPKYIKGSLARHGKQVACASKQAAIGGSLEEAAIGGSDDPLSRGAKTPVDAPSYSSQAYSSQAKPKDPPTPQGGKEPAEKPRTVELADIEFPPSMDTPEVRAAMGEWLKHHRTIRKPYRDPTYLVTLLAEFVRDGPRGPAEFVAAVRFSIARNYQGLVRPKEGHHGKQSVEERQLSELDKAKRRLAERESGGGGPGHPDSPLRGLPGFS